MKETVTGIETIYEGRVVRLKRERVRLEDGRESVREVVRHPGSVTIVPLREDGSVLMVRQFRLPAGKELLELPAGTLEAGEEPKACAARELEEETGYRAESLEPLFSAYLAPGYSSELTHVFMATRLTPCPAQPDADEHLDLIEMPLAEAHRLAITGQLEDAKTIAALLVAWERVGVP